MAYRVGFDGKWQGRFDDMEDATQWGREVGETGRMVYVVRHGLFRAELVAIFPEDRSEAGEYLWRRRNIGSGGGGG